MTEKKSISYSDAGVDLGRGDRAKARIKALVESTFTEGVAAGFGHFGACFSGRFDGFDDPVMVSSTDSVGTKVKIACLMKKYDTVGLDIVNHCINDIAVMGAEPKFFLDYIGIGRLEPATVEKIIEGLAKACRNAGVALIGGEMAELPDLYQAGEFDLVGFIVGVVERRLMLDGSAIREGDLIYGFPSDGLHTNGYTLARKIVFEHKGWEVGRYFNELGSTIGEALLTPHRLYLPIIRSLRAKSGVKGFAHITGGGIVGNLKRIFSPGLTFRIDSTAWEIPVLFRLLQEAGNVDRAEMFRVFNMGIGLIGVIDREKAEQELAALHDRDRPILIGEVVKGDIPLLQIDG